MELYNLVSTLDDVDELPRREVDRIASFNQVDKPCESWSTDLLGESQRVKAIPIQGTPLLYQGTSRTTQREGNKEGVHFL
jgi:hypothetical protein